MGDATNPNSAQKLAHCSRLLLGALPVNSLREVLQSLCHIWQDVTDAKYAVVVTNSFDQTHRWIAVTSQSDETNILQFETSEPQNWHDEHLIAEVSFRTKLAQRTESKPVCVTFNDEDRTVGCALLLEPTSYSADSEITTFLADATARLIMQGRQQNALAVTEESGASPDAERLEALAEFAAGAGHEINNPIATISGRIQLLLKDETDPNRRQSLITIGGQAHRIRDMIGDVMLFGRPPEPNSQSLDLNKSIADVIELLEDDIASSGCRVDLQRNEPVSIWADRTQLSVVISNLLINSLNASPEEGPISIRAESVTDQNRKSALLTVSDQGSGFTETEQQHAFDPFFSGRQAGRGLGFGLPKCWRIVTNHHGRVELETHPDGPTVLRVFWPAEPSTKMNGRL